MFRIIKVVGACSLAMLLYSCSRFRFFGTWPWRYSLGNGRHCERLPLGAIVGERGPEGECGPRPTGRCKWTKDCDCGRRGDAGCRWTHGPSICEHGEVWPVSYRVCAFGPSSMVKSNSTVAPCSVYSSISSDAMLHTELDDRTFGKVGRLRACNATTSSLSSELSAAMVLTEQVEVTWCTSHGTFAKVSSECARPRNWHASSSLRRSCFSS
mmetsp:Transcript_10566/g.32966  ORF Transcript_10566/g.32966 Transcript_10566/m.32966 type:complete len:211 (-) Transcript_10566:629-1261(-)